GSLAARFDQRGAQVRYVLVPSEGSLVHRRRRDTEELHRAGSLPQSPGGAPRAPEGRVLVRRALQAPGSAPEGPRERPFTTAWARRAGKNRRKGRPSGE